MAYAVVRTDNMAGTDVRSMLVSVKYMGADGTTPTAIENGNVLKIGALATGEREIYVGGATAEDTKVSDVVLVASPEVMYDERKKNLDEFINEAGKIVRGYRLHSGDVFSVTKEAISGTAAVGDAVALGAGTKLVAKGTGTAVGKVIALETAGRYNYIVIKVD